MTSAHRWRARARALLGLSTLAWAGLAGAAADIDALWDFTRPAVSEQRFRAALAQADGDAALVLRTQIARTLGLRGRFEEGHRELDEVDRQLAAAGPEPRVRARLERGRLLRSSGHPGLARPLFVQAYDTAEAHGLAALAGDALHMVALVEPTLEGQLAWNQRTIDHARAASDPKARRWEAPALNNMGSSLRSAGRLEPSLAVFRQALAAYERLGRPDRIAFARWQVAHGLRLLGRLDESLALLLALEREGALRGVPDPDVLQELALLYDALGDDRQAARYRALRHRAQSTMKEAA